MKNTLNLVDSLSRTLKMLQPLSPENQLRLEEKVRLEFNYNSVRLTGYMLSYGDTELLLLSDKTTGNHTLREYKVMKAHDRAFQLITTFAADKDNTLSYSIIKALHEILIIKPFWEDSVSLYPGEPVPTGVLPEEAPPEIEQLIHWYQEEERKNQLHPVEMAALFHARFMNLATLDKGLGRIARLSMNFILLRHDFPAAIIKYSDKDNYRTALDLAKGGAYDPFIGYIAGLVAQGFELSFKAVRGEPLMEDDPISDEIKDWKDKAIKQKGSIHHRCDMYLEQIYSNGIRKLFEAYIEEHLKQFSDLFKEVEITSHSQMASGKGLAWLTDDIKDRAKSDAHYSPIERIGGQVYDVPPADSYRRIGVNILMKEYKHKEYQRFYIPISLNIDLQPYKYFVEFGDRKPKAPILAEKNYDEYLSAEERDKIVAYCLQKSFQMIQTSAGI